MPIKSSHRTDDSKNDAPLTHDEKMDLIVHYLQRMDRRDQMRMAGGYIRGLFALVSFGFLVWSIWYFAVHGDELMKQITSEAVKQSAEYSQDSLMEQLQEAMEQQR